MAADLERQKLVLTLVSGMVKEGLWLPTPDFFNETCGGKLNVSVQLKTRRGNFKNCNPTAHLFDEKTKKIALYFLQQKILYFT
jgi:hypothetical protein